MSTDIKRGAHLNFLAGAAALFRVRPVIVASFSAAKSLMLSSVTGTKSRVFVVIESREVEVCLSVVKATVILV